MTLNTREMWSNGIKIAFYFKKLQKIAKTLGASPKPLKPLVAGGSAPRALSVIHLSYISLLNTSLKLNICTF